MPSTTQEKVEKKPEKQRFDPRIEQRIKDLRAESKKHLAAGQYHEALSCLDLAIDLHSSSYKLYRLRSIANACLQEYESAAADADKVIQLAPNIMDGYWHKGYALFQLKRYSEAAHAFQDGLKLNPADKVLRQGFWDAINLLSQSRAEAGGPLAHLAEVVHEVHNKSLFTSEAGSTSATPAPQSHTSSSPIPPYMHLLESSNGSNRSTPVPSMAPLTLKEGGVDAASATASLLPPHLAAMAKEGGAGAAAAAVRGSGSGSGRSTPLLPPSVVGDNKPASKPSSPGAGAQLQPDPAAVERAAG